MKPEKEFDESLEKEIHAKEHKKEEVSPEHVKEALDRYAEEYRGKSGVDPNDHPHFAKAKQLLGKMTCR
jgi:hypothetical protein